jgi:glucose/mannose-6-phosphate isomerase
MMDEHLDLDDPEVYRRLDPDGMLERLHEFPGECEKAYKMATAFPLPERLATARNVVVLGMGGSAIGGDLVGALVTPESRIPFEICRGYSLPGFVDSQTLVIASSYSGNTEETLSCFAQSVARGAKNLVITTGGKLKELGEANHVPTFVFDYRSPPRAALPYSFVALLCFMDRLGFLKGGSAAIAGLPSILRSQARSLEESIPTASNPAKKLAHQLHNRIAVIYGAELTAEAAHRWKTQVNENSKAWAFYDVLPEMNHNSVVGYEFPAALNKEMFVTLLESPFLSDRVRVRYEVVQRLLARAGIDHASVSGVGDSRIAQLMSLVLLGDYVSYYLAILYGTNPGPVKVIDYLKAELAKTQDRGPEPKQG